MSEKARDILLLAAQLASQPPNIGGLISLASESLQASTIEKGAALRAAKDVLGMPIHAPFGKGPVIKTHEQMADILKRAAEVAVVG